MSDGEYHVLMVFKVAINEWHSFYKTARALEDDIQSGVLMVKMTY